MAHVSFSMLVLWPLSHSEILLRMIFSSNLVVQILNCVKNWVFSRSMFGKIFLKSLKTQGCNLMFLDRHDLGYNCLFSLWQKLFVEGGKVVCIKIYAKNVYIQKLYTTLLYLQFLHLEAIALISARKLTRKLWVMFYIVGNGVSSILYST